MAERKTKIDPSEFSESGYWAIRLEYRDSTGPISKDGSRDQWLPLLLPGVKAEYQATKMSDAINGLSGDIFSTFTRPDSDGSEFRTRARLLAVLEIRIAMRRVSPYKEATVPTRDLQLTIAKALRAEGIPIMAPGYPDPTPTPTPKHDPYEDKPARKRTPALRGSDIGPPPELPPEAWDWAKRISDHHGDDDPDPYFPDLEPTEEEVADIEALIEAAPDFDWDGTIDEPMQRDIPIELLPETPPSRTKKHLSGTRVAEADEV